MPKGLVDDRLDADGDGYVAADGGGDDCDDADLSVNPGVVEQCGNGVDDDCDGAVDDDGVGAIAWYADDDGDGHGAGEAVTACEAPPGTVQSAADCEDADPLISPDAPEQCDGVDNDCDGLVDDDDATLIDEPSWFLDADADGYGTDEGAVRACEAPPGYVATAGDCDDASPGVNPSADEVCDGQDNDCDTLADDDDDDTVVSEGGVVAYPDGDGDGFGDATAAGVPVCDLGVGQADNATDCDDSDPAVKPDALEVCGGADEDCDGLVDDADPSLVQATTTAWYADGDGDGYGAGAPWYACDGGSGVPEGTDCDDADAAVSPGMAEACTGVDDDCDGLIDDADDSVDPATYTVWFADADGDGFGDAAASVAACQAPSGHVAVDTDCDDAAPAVHPGVSEVCNGWDDDCDGAADDADPATDPATMTIWWFDGDGDGYGDDAISSVACEAPTDFVGVAGDCEDGVFEVNPAATEVCNGWDDDCDGLPEDTDPTLDLSTRTTFYTDVDGDGYGDPATAIERCDGTGLVALGDDCSPSDPAVHPGAAEICATAYDDDCDGLVNDEPGADPSDATSAWADLDGDGWGGVDRVEVCDIPSGYVASEGDCDDGDPAIHPGATQTCDGVDRDCDGLVDDADPSTAPESMQTYYLDEDADGFGSPDASALACDLPSGHSVLATDCDDANAAINPGAVEVCNAGVDDDCDGLADDADPVLDLSTAVTIYRDGDGDGWGEDSTTSVACVPGSGWVAVPGDCDDGLAHVNPDGIEVCDGALDEDCDGLVDDADGSVDVASLLTWFEDGDADGYGEPSSSLAACAAPTGYVADATDCDDAMWVVNPGRDELCATAWDDDCDGLANDDAGAEPTDPASWYADADGDGFGDVDSLSLACDAPSGTVADSADCDDTMASVSPAAIEVCATAWDDDCDGGANDADPDTPWDAIPWFADIDGDGYGSDASEVEPSCEAPSALYVAAGGDCDDLTAAANPGEPEICDGIDNDCNSLADDDDPSVDPATWHDFYFDGDGDGFGDPTLPSAACEAPAGFVAAGTDCDDGVMETYPGAQEICGGAGAGGDDDCDGLVDDADPSLDLATRATWFDDADGDGFGTSDVVALSCAAPAGHVADDTDCDDARADVSPAGAEVCDGAADEDCDGLVDDADPTVDAATFATWFADTDGDGFGDAAVTDLACAARAGFVADDADCDDARSDVNPAGTEVCDGSADEDCDGLVDDADPSTSPASKTDWYSDGDGDGYGRLGVTVAACAAPAGRVSNASDCNDGNAAISPAATEVCDGAVDEDCDTLVDDADPSVDATSFSLFYLDSDGDGFGDAAMDIGACAPPSGYVAGSTDCDDSRSDVSPAGTEVCDGAADEDCDGLVDDADPSTSPASKSTWYADLDADGYGGFAASPVLLCAPGPRADNNADCDDALPDVNPSAVEVCENGLDDDCDGSTWCTFDGLYDMTDAYDVLLEGGASGTMAGVAAGVGDIDGDGVDDLAVAAPYGDFLTTEGGRIWLIAGPPTSGTLTADLGSFWGTTDGDMVGAGLVSGDFNGDAVIDLAIGAPITGGPTDPGEVSVFFGPIPLGTSSFDAADARFVGSTAEFLEDTSMLNRLAAADPFEGGGASALAVGSPTADGGAGQVHVFRSFGSGTFDESDAVTLISGGARYLGTGATVAVAGDLDGDGVREIAVGVEQATSGASGGGCVAVFYGPSAGALTPDDADVRSCGGDAQETREVAVAVGDVTGIGRPSLLVGAPDAGGGPGYVRVRTDDGTGALSYTAEIEGVVAGSRFARDASDVGDVDLDGLHDFVVGTRDTGRAFLFYGSSDWLSGFYDASAAGATFLPESEDYRLGMGIARIGDVDGDGVEDIGLPADSRTSDAGLTEAGSLYLMWGARL